MVEEIGGEEEKILHSRRLAKLDEDRLVKVVADKLRMDGDRMVERIFTVEEEV